MRCNKACTITILISAHDQKCTADSFFFFLIRTHIFACFFNCHNKLDIKCKCKTGNFLILIHISLASFMTHG